MTASCHFFHSHLIAPRGPACSKDVPGNVGGMSISALLRGVETRLRSADVLNDMLADPIGKVCGVTLAPGKPSPGFGQIWYAVHWSGGRGNDRNPQGHDVLHAVTVTITARLANLPRDRRAKQAAAAGQLLDLVDAVAAPNVIHGNYDVLAAANALIPGTAEYLTANAGDPTTATVNGFLEPLVLLDFGPEREEGPDWIGAEQASDIYVIPVRFGDARRVREYTG